MTSLSLTPAWKTLERLAQDPARGTEQPEALTLPFGPHMLFDFSRWPVAPAVLAGLFDLARQEDLSGFISAMFSGAHLNTTEDRAVLHVALRHQGPGPFPTPADVMPLVRAQRERMALLVDRIRMGDWRGFDGRAIETVICIGIGGSDLGPRMVVDALRPLADGPEVRFVSNVDSTDLLDALCGCDPATTLFVIVSKTFSTQETMTNAVSARDWLLANGGDFSAVAKHFIAVSTNLGAVEAFGIDPANTLEFWDWVGGRFSLWSTVGFGIALAIGNRHHAALLEGAAAMDEHWRSAPLERNIPVIAGLLGLWQSSFRRAPVMACLPYDQHLALLPSWLQQTSMESNGKRVTRDGAPVDYPVGEIVFGAAGTNGQHSFHQLLHQGTADVAIDLILVAKSGHPLADHRTLLVANGLAQGWAFARGAKTDVASDTALPPHRQSPGNRSVSTILMDRLTPHTLGALLAFYEAKVATQGALWRINSFDQFGVELGKQLAGLLVPALAGAPPPAGLDAAGRRQLDWLQSVR